MALTFKSKAPSSVSNFLKDEDALSKPVGGTSNIKQKSVNYFWLRKGESRKIIILDEKPVVRLSFHLDTANKYEKVPCIKQHDNCPICDMSGTNNSRFTKDRSYIIVTVLDLTPWVTDKGLEIPYTKRIWAIETEAQRSVVSKYLDKYGTTRGLVLEMHRNGTKGEGPSGTAMYDDFLTESSIQENFNNPEILNQEGKVIKSAGVDMKVFDYEKLYVLPSASELRAKYNMAAPLGSRDSYSEVAPAATRSTYVDPSEYNEPIHDIDDSDIPF